MTQNKSTHEQRFIDTSTRRAQKFEMVQATWHESHTIEIGGEQPPSLVRDTGDLPADAPIFQFGIPHVRRKFDLPKSLSLNGTMMRFKTHSLSICDQLNIRYHDHEASNNGEYSRLSLEHGRGMLHHRADVNAYSSLIGLFPIMLSVRAINDPVFHNHTSVESDDVEDDGIYRIESGKRKPNRNSHMQEKIWLDPLKDFLPIRIERYRINMHVTLVDAFEIELSELPDLGWMPIGWTWRQYRTSDELRQTVIATEVQFSMEPTTKRDFDLLFAPGTKVTQRRGDGTTWIASESGDLVVENKQS